MLDAKGSVQETVYEAAWGDAGKCTPGADGNLPPAGSTVDVGTPAGATPWAIQS